VKYRNKSIFFSIIKKTKKCMKNLLFAFLLALTFWTCAKEECPEGICSPKLVWSKPLEGGKFNTSFIPVVYKEKVVYSRAVVEGKLNSIQLLFLNTADGTLRSEWNDFQKTDDVIETDQVKYVKDNNLAFANQADIYAIDMESEKTIYTSISTNWDNWKLNTLTGLGKNTIYHAERQWSGLTYEKIIKEYNLETQTSRDIYKIEKKVGHSTLDVLNTPTPYIDKQNDTLLFFNQFI
jgi:hypothetical protein